MEALQWMAAYRLVLCYLTIHACNLLIMQTQFMGARGYRTTASRIFGAALCMVLDHKPALAKSITIAQLRLRN